METYLKRSAFRSLGRSPSVFGTLRERIKQPHHRASFREKPVGTERAGEIHQAGNGACLRKLTTRAQCSTDDAPLKSVPV